MKSLMLILLTTALLQARTITVGPTGADHTTIAAGVTAASAGDVVEVAAGTYDERITISKSGTAGSLITVKAVPRRQAICKGFVLQGQYVRVEGFEVANTSLTGIQLKGSHNEAVDNYLHDLYQALGVNGSNNYAGYNRAYRCQYSIIVSGTKLLVEHNEVERVVQIRTNSDADYCRFFGDSLTFRHNNFHGTDLAETGSAHVDCYQTFDNNGEHARDVLWEYNILSDCHQGLMSEGKFHKNNGNYTFRNNIFQNLASFGIMGTEVFNITVVHNTFVNCGSWGVAINGASSTGYVIKNNIFFHITDDVIKINTSAPIDYDYNLYVWYIMKTSSPGPHDVVNKWPLFVDRNSDFRLQAGSPCIDAAADLGVTDDFEGNPRQQPDIGAYEYTGSTGIRIADRSAALPVLPIPQLYSIDGRTVTRKYTGIHLFRNGQAQTPYKMFFRIDK